MGLAVVVSAGVTAPTRPPKRPGAGVAPSEVGAGVRAPARPPKSPGTGVAPVVLLVVVGAAVRAPMRPPNSPPGAAVVAGAAVEAEAAVLEVPATGMQLGFLRPSESLPTGMMPTALGQ